RLTVVVDVINRTNCSAKGNTRSIRGLVVCTQTKGVTTRTSLHDLDTPSLTNHGTRRRTQDCVTRKSHLEIDTAGHIPSQSTGSAAERNDSKSILNRVGRDDLTSRKSPVVGSASDIRSRDLTI